MSKEQIIQGALALDESERELLAEMLWHSVDHSSPQEIEEAWAKEIAIRIESLDNGTSKLLDGDEVMNTLRVKYSSK